MLERQGNRCLEDLQQHRRGSLRDDVFCVEVLIWLVIAQTETSHLAKGFEGTPR